MMKLLIPLLLALAGLAAGAGAGWYMRPPPPPAASAAPENGAEGAAGMAHAATPRPESTSSETLPMTGQFLVPLVAGGGMHAVVVIGLALELPTDHGVTLSRHEARLRAGFLQALFDHANLGGFEGVFTSGENLLNLRRRLRDIAREELGDTVRDVLITELMRQES